MAEYLSVADLVTRAKNGEQQAWDALVERYAPLIWSICRRHRLADVDADDVAQGVWLRLVDQLDKVRDPAALPGWLVTTTSPRPPRSAEAAGRCRADGPAQDGHLPFTPVAKYILELTVRETRTLQDPNVGVQHIALALTAVRRGMVPSLLAAADESAPALHTEILDRYRQAS